MKAEIGTPFGSSQAGSMTGHCAAGVVNRPLGCAALRPEFGVHDSPSQSIKCSGASFVIPSHQTSLSSVKATLVKMVLHLIVRIALGLDSKEVPGATPKKPASGLIAYKRPSFPK